MRIEPPDPLALRLARTLDRGGLTPHQAARLAEARRRALEVSIAGTGRRLADVLASAAAPAARAALAAGLVLGLALVVDQLDATRERAEMQRLERALLVDDLPIDAYLDDGFPAWIAAERDS